MTSTAKEAKLKTTGLALAPVNENEPTTTTTISQNESGDDGKTSGENDGSAKKKPPPPPAKEARLKTTGLDLAPVNHNELMTTTTTSQNESGDDGKTSGENDGPSLMKQEAGLPAKKKPPPPPAKEARLRTTGLALAPVNFNKPMTTMTSQNKSGDDVSDVPQRTTRDTRTYRERRQDAEREETNDFRRGELPSQISVSEIPGAFRVSGLKTMPIQRASDGSQVSVIPSHSSNPRISTGSGNGSGTTLCFEGILVEEDETASDAPQPDPVLAVTAKKVSSNKWWYLLIVIAVLAAALAIVFSTRPDDQSRNSSSTGGKENQESQNNVTNAPTMIPSTLPPTLEAIQERGYIRCRAVPSEREQGFGFSIDLVRSIEDTNLLTSLFFLFSLPNPSHL
jgi:hypothetical protein